jgi:hypothetical protein
MCNVIRTYEGGRRGRKGGRRPGEGKIEEEIRMFGKCVCDLNVIEINNRETPKPNTTPPHTSPHLSHCHPASVSTYPFAD